MIKIGKLVLTIFTFYYSSTLYASHSLLSSPLLHESHQLLLVRSPNWDANHGTLERYQRNDSQHQWSEVGQPISVVLGKHGMAWGSNLQKDHAEGPIKKEGDLRTPAGIFKLGPAFGFATTTNTEKNMRLPYVALTDTTVCVDDEKSIYYNQVVDRKMLVKSDWRSGEQMRQIPSYKWGAIIQYNMQPTVRAAGSCIFMHIASPASTGTAGCVAMSESHIKELLAWLDPEKKPVIALEPVSDNTPAILNDENKAEHLQ